MGTSFEIVTEDSVEVHLMHETAVARVESHLILLLKQLLPQQCVLHLESSQHQLGEEVGIIELFGYCKSGTS